VGEAAFLHNRELYHFTIRWAQEEDNHARALARYQVVTGMAEPDQLRRDLAVEACVPRYRLMNRWTAVAVAQPSPTSSSATSPAACGPAHWSAKPIAAMMTA
jgi:hypothetical protein